MDHGVTREPDYDLAHRLRGTSLTEQDVANNHHAPSPIMVLPTMGPVRYPRLRGDDAGQPDRFDLEGESDEDDAHLQAAMRARLSDEPGGYSGTGERARPSAPPAVSHKR